MISANPAHDSGRLIDTLGHYLVAIDGTELGKRIEIGAAPLTIGRHDHQTLVLKGDSEVSRVHARLSLVNGDVLAEDLGSTNGTFVDDVRITGTVTLREGSVIQVGKQLLKYERRSRRDVQRIHELDGDLHRASNYLLSMLPVPLGTGPVHADWCFVPSAQLGGDAFGYEWLNPTTFVFYLIDVSGHGAGAALHSVAVLNILRQRALAVDYENPGDVLSSLNARFQMERYNDLYFTMWYGVYRTDARSLTYASGGHHAAYLVPPDREAAVPLGTPALMIGAVPDYTYDVRQANVAAGSCLYLFSDGVFEIVGNDGRLWALEDFLPFLTAPLRPGTSEPERLYQLVRQAAQPGSLPDDFSLLAVTFQ